MLCVHFSFEILQFRKDRAIDEGGRLYFTSSKGPDNPVSHAHANECTKCHKVASGFLPINGIQMSNVWCHE